MHTGCFYISIYFSLKMSRTIDINSSSSSSSNHVSGRSLELMILLRGRQRPARRSLTRLSETICVDGHLIATRCRRISVSSTDHCVRTAAAAAAATIADFCRRVNNCRAARVTGRRSFFLPVSALIGRHDNLRSVRRFYASRHMRLPRREMSFVS